MIQLKLNPDNPRSIRTIQYDKLKKSLKEFPQMLELRPIIYDENNVILGGNMRYKALQDLEKEGMEIKDEWFKNIADLTEQQKREFVIKDNVPFGDWDWDILANEWSDLPLEDWGINITPIIPSVNVDEMWQDMPEFGDKSGFESFRNLMVHFESQDDLDKFARLVGETISEKTKYIWYPRKEKQDTISISVVTEE